MSARKSRITPKKRIIEFNEASLQERSGQLWCKICNVEIDYIKNSSVKQHLDTKSHKNLVDCVSKNKKAKFDGNKKNDRSTIKNEFASDLMAGFAAANIPVHKLKNKNLQKCFTKYLKDEVSTAWPSTTTVRKTLPKIHQNELEQLKDAFNGKKIAIIADETTDVEQREFLNILFLELDCFKGCKPLLTETFFLAVKNLFLF